MTSARPGTAPGWLTLLASRAGELAVPPRMQAPPQGGRSSAVLLLFGETDGEADLLIVQRSPHLRRHAGQPAFPGGAMEPSDGGPVGAALREAAEEAGVDPAGVEVLGVLPELFIARSGFRVTPVLAWWREPSPLVAASDGEIVSAVRPRPCALTRSSIELFRRLAARRGWHHRNAMASKRSSGSEPTSGRSWSSADGIAVLDEAGLVRQWNPAAHRITGMAGPDAIGKPPPFPLPEPDAMLTHKLSNGRWLDVLCTALADDGELVIDFRDVTAAKELEEAKDLFLATTSHELRTPITVVQGLGRRACR